MKSIYCEDRLNYLAGQIAGMFSGHVKPEKLGNIALEVMVARENVEEIIKGKYSAKEKRVAKKNLEHLKDIEKNIVRLYFLEKFGSTNVKKSPFLNYMIEKYSSSR